MNQLKLMRLFACGLCLLTLSAYAKAQSNVFVYDWSTANASPAGVILDNTIGVTGIENDGWERVPDGLPPIPTRGLDDIVRNTGQPDPFFTGHYYTTTIGEPRSIDDNDDRYLRKNDAAFSFSIPANANTVDLSFVLQANANMNTARFGLEDIRAINFGVFGPIGGPGTWGVRSVDGVTTGANITGAAQLDQTLRTYRANLTIDLTVDGPVKTVDLVVENLTDGGSEVIFDDLPYNLGANADPTLWDELSLRAGSTSIDDLRVAYTIPEPSAGMLLLCGATGVCLRRRAA